jgi:hypothetical protein
MSSTVKFLIGLAAVVLMTWLWHGPLGNGAALIGGIESGAKKAVAATELPGIEVRLGHDPLSRTATLSGPANSFQREGGGEGMYGEPGLTDIVRSIEGVGAVRWADEPGGAGGGLPLLVEALLLAMLAFLLGLGAAWLLWGRPRRESYL